LAVWENEDSEVIKEREDGNQEWNVFSQQTFRRTVRNVERKKVETRSSDDARHGAEWVPAHELVDLLMSVLFTQ